MDPPTFLTPNIDTDNFATANNPATESQPIKRKRLTQACDACRKKKVKCSGDKPSCNNCSRLGMTCTYLPSTRKRGPRVGLVESLEKRLQQMEKLLQPLKEQRLIDDVEDKKSVKKPRLNSKNSETNNSDISINPYNESQPEFINIFSQTQVVEQKQTQHEQISNVDNNITSEDEDDELIFFGKSSANPGYRHRKEAFVHCDLDVSIKSEPSEINEHSSSPESNSSIEDIPIISPITAVISNKNSEFPPLEMVQHLAACFFRHMDTQMPMFHEATFMNQLRQNKISPILVYAMCAVSARYSNNPSILRDPPYKSGEPFAAIALNKYLFDTFDYPSVEHVQGLILLTKHMYGIGKGPRAWMFTGMAVRMAQELGLHKVDESGSKPSNSSETFFIQKEIRRRTFWSCFLLDRFAACALGRPTLIDEDDCDVKLPCHEAIWNLERPFESPLIGEFFKDEKINHGARLALTNTGMSACLVSVTALLGRVCQHVNRSKPYDALPPWDPNSQFASLKNELDTWYRSLTPHYTYKKEKMQQLMADGLGTAFALVHLLYCSAIVALNKPNIDLLQNEGVEDQHVEFMRASAERCSDAAQLISSIAEDINQYKCHHLCPFSLYPIFTTTQIHINNTYHLDIIIAEKAEKNLFINEELLKSMGPYWAMASKLLQIVVDMRKTLANNQRVRDVSFNKGNGSEQDGEISTVGLKPYWNRVNNNNSLIETNLDNISSIILPEQLSSPRWLNDTSIVNESWTSFLRSPGPLLSGPFSPSLLRIMKKENDSSDENNYDYFSQDVTAYSSPPAFVYDGYPMIDMSSDWSTTAGRVFPLSRPIKHWTNINGNIINSAIEDTPTSTTTFTPLLATTSTGDINIDSLLI